MAPDALFHRGVIGRAHHEHARRDRHAVFARQLLPLRIGGELRPHVLAVRAIAIGIHTSVSGLPRCCHTPTICAPCFWKMATSFSRNRWCSSLMLPLKVPVPTRVLSTVYIRTSKQRDFG